MKLVLDRGGYQINFDNIVNKEFPHIDNYPGIDLANGDQCIVSDLFTDLFITTRNISEIISNQLEE